MDKLVQVKPTPCLAAIGKMPLKNKLKHVIRTPSLKTWYRMRTMLDSSLGQFIHCSNKSKDSHKPKQKHSTSTVHSSKSTTKRSMTSCKTSPNQRPSISTSPKSMGSLSKVLPNTQLLITSIVSSS